MTENKNNPILEAVNSVIGFPTIENLLCDGHAVKYHELKAVLGNRLIVQERKLCKSHIKGLAASIMEFNAVVIPLTVERQGNNYILTDGYHRLAALEMIKENYPSLNISVNIKIKK